jgi:hypothetical protein
MARTQGSGAPNGMVLHQADAVLSQANPVSATLYPVLPTTANVRVISIETNLTWAVTQPTPLEVVMTIDGNTIIWTQANPVTATPYYARVRAGFTELTQDFEATSSSPQRSFMLEGRSVKIEVRVTWAVTQPSPLNCRVKYSRLP